MTFRLRLRSAVVLLLAAATNGVVHDVVEVERPDGAAQQQQLSRLIALHNADAIFDHVVVVGGNASERSAFTTALQAHSIPHRVVKRAAHSTFRLPSEARGLFSNGSRVADFQPNKYHRYNDIIAFLQAAAAEYPDLVEAFTMGKSMQRRKIHGVKIDKKQSDNNAEEKKLTIWVDGGMHAREWISQATSLYLVWALLTRQHDAKIAALLDSATIYVVPVVNPDGYEYSWMHGQRWWRKNRSGLFCRWSGVAVGNRECCGVDLNRNFPKAWGVSGGSTSPCSDVYQGGRSLSEAESVNYAHKVSTLKDDIQLLLTLHSFGQTVLVPYGYATDAYPADYNETLRVAQAGVAQMNVPYNGRYTAIHSAGLYPAGGGSDDWAKAIGIPYVYTVELRPNEPADAAAFSMDLFHVDAAQIPETGIELIYGMDAMIAAIRQAP